MKVSWDDERSREIGARARVVVLVQAVRRSERTWRVRLPRLIFLAMFVFMIWATGRAIDAEAHWQPGLHNTRHAINLAWCGRSNTYCHTGAQAWAVAGCETGRTYSVWANNGQYLGLFQVSSHWRSSISGFAFNPWAQARHAHRIYTLTGGWSHWECQP